MYDTEFAILLTGFSVFNALLIALTHFRRESYQDQVAAQVMGLVLLLVLTCLQLMHFSYLQYQSELIYSAYYRVSLFVVAPALYLFSKPILQAYNEYYPIQLLHFLPVLVAPFLDYSVALPLSFVIGAGHLLWLARGVNALKAQRKRFKQELMILGIVFLIALIVAILGMGLSFISEPLFIALYASAIGFAFLLTSVVLSQSPRLQVEVTEAARASYAKSALRGMDCNAMIKKLELLMEQERFYQNADLDLTMLANQLDLSTHQLSKLINTHLGKGFSRFVREYRVSAAQEMLRSEPSSSILSVGLSVGFISQSNFYDAFREIVGMTPGRYRKLYKQSISE